MLGGDMCGGGHAWQGDMCGGGMCGRGACMVGGHTCHRGVCMAGRVCHGGMCGRGACVVGDMCVTGEMATAVGSTHPPGMHSCNLLRTLSLKNSVHYSIFEYLDLI